MLILQFADGDLLLSVKVNSGATTPVNITNAEKPFSCSGFQPMQSSNIPQIQLLTLTTCLCSSVFND